MEKILCEPLQDLNSPFYDTVRAELTTKITKISPPRYFCEFSETFLKHIMLSVMLL